jgi:hypothetical protein
MPKPFPQPTTAVRPGSPTRSTRPPVAQPPASTRPVQPNPTFAPAPGSSTRATRPGK